MLVRVFLMLFIATQVRAGMVYRFTMKNSGDPLVPKTSGRVFIDGDRYREELDPTGEPRAADVVISRDRDQTALMVNLQNSTWYERDERTAVSSQLFSLGTATRIKGKPSFNSQDEPSDEKILGHATRKHVLRFAYRFISNFPDELSVPGSVDTTVIILIATDLQPSPKRSMIRTGLAELDPELSRIEAAFDGMVLQQTVSVTRILEGGPPVRTLITTNVEAIETENVPASMFEVPKGFRHQEPQTVGPSVIRR